MVTGLELDLLGDMWYNISMSDIPAYQERHKRYYKENRKHLIYTASKWRRDNIGKQRMYILGRQAGLHWYKVTKGCTDCGAKDYRILEFDHVPELDDGTSRCDVRSTMSMVRLMHEISKCEVVCGNCHAIRTYQRRLDNKDESWYTSK